MSVVLSSANENLGVAMLIRVFLLKIVYILNMLYQSTETVDLKGGNM